MLLKLVLPDLSRTIPGGVVQKWHVEEGDEVGFGDDLFDLHVGEVTKAVRPLGADQVSGAGASEVVLARRETDFRVRVTSADAGYLRRILAPVGATLEPGGVAAVFALEADEVVPDDADAVAGAPEVRVAANILQGDEVDP